MKSPGSVITSYFLFSLVAFSTAAQTNKITVAEAKDHTGENRTVLREGSEHRLTEGSPRL
jgi:hypothetical protein